MHSGLTYYAILEVPESASSSDLKTAYRTLAQQYHPDKVPPHLTKIRKDAEEKFKRIDEAYKTLSIPERRMDYDARLAEQRAPKGNASPKPSSPQPGSPTPSLMRRIPPWVVAVISSFLSFNILPYIFSQDVKTGIWPFSKVNHVTDWTTVNVWTAIITVGSFFTVRILLSALNANVADAKQGGHE